MNKDNVSLALGNLDKKIRQIHTLILSKPHLREFADVVHPIPNTYTGSGRIKLIVIGQDPTIANKASRKKITTVLDLDKPGKMQRYIFGICEELCIDPFKELYATNLFKNFFDEPPGFSAGVMDKFVSLWLPVLQEEVMLFPDIPIITLGDNVLGYITTEKTNNYIRNYWGYTEDWKTGANLPLRHIMPDENLFGRVIFPFPREPNMHKQFYTDRYKSYIEHVKKIISVLPYEAA